MFKGITILRNIKEFKGIQGCAIKHFAFYYDDRYLIYKEAKYGVSYWLQEPQFNQFKGTKERDDLYNDDLEGDTFSNTESIRVRFFAIQAGINADLA